MATFSTIFASIASILALICLIGVNCNSFVSGENFYTSRDDLDGGRRVGFGDVDIYDSPKQQHYELVDRQLNSAGDYQPRVVPQQDLRLAMQQVPVRRSGYSPKSQFFSQGNFVSLPYLQPSGNSRGYHSLVDEFKGWSGFANPMREGRAFKPRLMSTARGFGKRSVGQLTIDEPTFNAPSYQRDIQGSSADTIKQQISSR